MDVSAERKQVHFDPSVELKDPKEPLVFNTMALDYENCEVNPEENPLYIAHAYLNKGEYPP